MDFRTHVEKLEGAGNWTKWRRQVELLLRHHEVFEVASGEQKMPEEPDAGDTAALSMLLTKRHLRKVML